MHGWSSQPIGRSSRKHSIKKMGRDGSTKGRLPGRLPREDAGDFYRVDLALQCVSAETQEAIYSLAERPRCPKGWAVSVT
jgi:hypothetical protein